MQIGLCCHVPLVHHGMPALQAQPKPSPAPLLDGPPAARLAPRPALPGSPPDVISRFSSHAFMSFCSSLARLLCASDIIVPSRRCSRFCSRMGRERSEGAACARVVRH